jgi:hypothetical protein
MFFKDRCPVNNIIGIPAKVDDLSQEEGGAEHCEDEAERGPGSEEDGAFHLHAPSLQVVAQSHHYKPLIHPSMHPFNNISHIVIIIAVYQHIFNLLLLVNSVES